MPALTLKANVTKSNFGQHLRRYLDTKHMADEIAARVRKQRDALIAYVEKRGIEDQDGHLWVEVPEVGKAKRERRVSNVFDADFAEEYLRGHGGDLWEQCTETITVIDEDAVLAKIYDGTIPEEIGDQMYSQKEIFAFKVIES